MLPLPFRSYRHGVTFFVILERCIEFAWAMPNYSKFLSLRSLR
jgi:hypothetical protein